MNWQRNSKSYNVNEAFVLDETLPKGKNETIRERSDSQSSVEDDGPVPHPRGLPTKAESIDFGLDEEVDTRKPYRDCLVGCFVVFFVLALMTCVAIILYFVLINTVFAKAVTKTLTGALTVEGSLLLNETYQPDLADPQSMAFREMENRFLSSVNASFINSTLAEMYDGAKVERFEQGSIRIVFTIFLLSAPNDADTEAGVIFEVQVTIGDGISSGFFDDFDVIEDSLEITSVNQEIPTTTYPPTTTSTEAPVDQSTVTTIYSATTQIISSLSTLLSTPVTTTSTVPLTTKPTTSRLFSTHSPTSATFAPTTPSTTWTKSTSSTLSPTTRTETTTSALITTVEYSPSTVHRTTQQTTIPLSSTDISKTDTAIPTTVPSTPLKQSTTSSTTRDISTGLFNVTTKVTTMPLSSTGFPTSDTTKHTTVPSTPENLSTTSSTTTENSTGTFHFTIITTTIPPSPTNSPTSLIAHNTTPSTTRPISSTTSPIAAETTTPTTTAALNLTTHKPSTDAPTSTTMFNTTTAESPQSSSPSSPISPAAKVNITRQPKIHPALPDVCGIRPALNESDDGTARIVGGTQSAAGTWPWMGSLRQGESHQCGAVLIHQEWAITAHHCIGYFDKIVLGDNDLYGNTNTSPYRVQRYVQAFSNPDFDHVTDNGDIALVYLTEPVEFNDHVQPLCINTLMTEMKSFNNCFVTGWGTDDISNQVAMRYLQEADVQIFDRVNCSQWYQAFHTITNQHICAGEEDGRRDACSGDSGGPLQCQDDQGIWYLLGLVSFGQDCGQPRLPGVYTRVSTQIPFLSQILDTNIK